MNRRICHSLVRTIAAAAGVTGLFVSIGCGSKPVAVDREVIRLFDAPKARPASLSRTNLRLLHQSRALYVGDDQSRAYDVFGPPTGATDVGELPDGWDKEHYRVKGWEKGKDGFGLILVDDDVALAVFTSEGKTDADVTALLNDYEEALGTPVKLGRGEILYRFWNANGQRVMISSLRTEGEGSKVTQALGANEIMDALRMNEANAKEDMARTEGLAAKQSP